MSDGTEDAGARAPLVLVITGLAVLTAVLFNVLAEFTGGLRSETRVPQRRRR
jgi:thiosulfate reductase cytochrome b subunit